MSIDDEEILSYEQTKEIVQNMIDAGRAAFFSWDIHNHKFNGLENITGRKIKNVNTLPDFLNQFVFEKDREMVLQDLDHFMEGEETTYQSTFRILNTEGKIRWIFCKGTLTAEKKLNGVMYNVSADNLKKGHDLKTNLMNGDTFMRKLKNAIDYAERNNQKGALLYVGIDNYHTITNKYGFEFGRSILYKTSRVLLEFVGDHDELAHISYTRFMILLNDVEDLAEVEQVSKEICNIFDESFNIDGQKIFLNISMGVTLFPEISTDADELMGFSDFAISHSRERGNSQAVFFDTELMTNYKRKTAIENELPTAILDQEFYLVYQPQVNIQTNKISGLETLIRWENKKLGLVSPSEFIPVAEKKGYIVSIGRWVRKESIQTAGRWLDKGINFEKISMNVSSLEFRQKNFKENLLLVCKQYDVEPSMIELEITERTFMHANEDNKKVISDLMKEGFRISLDDFGVGYSNISTLLNFSLNTLKLDKSLIDNIDNKIQRYVLKSIISAKELLHYNVVAEGVEDQATLDMLSDLDCDTVQGYYFSKPLPTHEIEKFISDFQENK